MKNRHAYAFSLSIAGCALLTPGWAQTAPAVPDVHVDTQVIELPDVHVDTQVLQLPQVHVETQVDGNGIVRIIQDRQAAKEKKLLLDTPDADALNKYTVAQVYQNLSTLYSPEMAKKTRDIALLRQMHALKLTAQDIEQALPLLRELKSVDKAVPAKPEQALDEEYRRLLRAKPDDPMPPSSAEALREAAGGFRNRKQAIWDKMAQQIGRTKAAGIRAMLRSEGAFSWSGTTMQNFFTPQTPLAPMRPRTRSTAPPAVRPAQPAPDAPAVPDNPVSARAAQGSAKLASAIVAPSAAAGGTQDAIAQTESAAHIARSRVATQAGAQTDADESQEKDLRDKEKAAIEKEKDVLKGAARAQRGTTANGWVLAPQTHTLTVGPGNRIVFGSYGQATLDELIDLFERHLAEMRR